LVSVYVDINLYETIGDLKALPPPHLPLSADFPNGEIIFNLNLIVRLQGRNS
jgi:hypothetical protein